MCEIDHRVTFLLIIDITAYLATKVILILNKKASIRTTK